MDALINYFAHSDGCSDILVAVGIFNLFVTVGLPAAGWLHILISNCSHYWSDELEVVRPEAYNF